MIIEIDLRSVPPALALREPDDFSAFSVRALGQHAFVDREILLALAGDRVGDAGWVAQLDAMLGYAESRGWVDAAGATRAHIEYVGEAGESPADPPPASPTAQSRPTQPR